MKILVDLHTHTLASGHAYSTITENALAAARRGLELLGIADHGPSLPGAPHLYHFNNLGVIPEKIHGVKVLAGVEANIISHEGELDLPVNILAELKLVLVGLHKVSYPGGTMEENTQAYIRAMKNPYTDIMVHPGRIDFEMDLEQIARASAQLNVPVEINNSSLSSIRAKNEARKNCSLFSRYMAKYKGPVVLGSDAHYWDRVGEFDDALDLVLEAGIPEQQILNTSPERVLDYLAVRRKHRPNVA
ncbi:MAG TPA: phosphatase [Desulfitobacteriaceae bacterium]|nr:phosphatase [Desulfitobacteriaceae bacterium]